MATSSANTTTIPSFVGDRVNLRSSMCSDPQEAWLSYAGEATLEGLALRVNAKENGEVFADFPGRGATNKFHKAVLANVGSTTTQVYNVTTGECLAMLDGGFKVWSESNETDLWKALQTFAKDPQNPDGDLLSTGLAIVGAPGYSVLGDEKWHAVSSIDAPICRSLNALETKYHEFHIAVLNRRPECGFKQPNCDWGSAYASLPLEVVVPAWPQGPRRQHLDGVIVDLGGGYSRAYKPTGEKIQAWATEFRPNIKANEFLFDGKEFHPERLGKLEGIYKEALNNLAAAHPELTDDKGVLNVHIIGTGKARDAMLK